MQEIIFQLTAKDDRYACALADKIIAESRETDEWYEYFEAFASLLNHPKSLVRNRALCILAANARWDAQDRFDAIFDAYLAHVTDEKPITARQCIKALSQIGLAKPQYIPKIKACLHSADLSKYRATPHKCVCGSQRIFCTISAVPKTGNTYSISAFSEL